MENRYGDLKTLFLAWSLRESLPTATSAIQYRHDLKNITNRFIDLYNKQITPQLFKMYNIGENDESSELLIAAIGDIANAFGEVHPTCYPMIAQLIRAYNNGDVKVMEEEA